MQRFRGIRRMVSAGLAVGALTMGLVAAAPAVTSGASTPTTATWAELPSDPPNYIFPFMSLAFFSVSNINQFQELMYRPLYWFGNGSTPNLNPSLSLAENPCTRTATPPSPSTSSPTSGRTVRRSPPRTSMFWMNMLHSEKSNWAAYSAGTLPDDVKSIVVNSPTQLTMNLTGAVNSYWFTYNELSQITPLPIAWDITATGGPPVRAAVRTHRSAPSTPSAPRSTPSCRSRRAMTRRTRRRPTTRCRPTPPTRSGRSSTVRGS